MGGVYGWAAVCFMFTKRERKHVHIFLAAACIIALLSRKLLLMMLKINKKETRKNRINGIMTDVDSSHHNDYSVSWKNMHLLCVLLDYNTYVALNHSLIWKF